MTLRSRASQSSRPTRVAAGRRVRTEHPFVAADFSPDGKRMIAADGDGFVRVYDAATAAELASFDTVPYLLRAAVIASRRTTGRLLVSPSKVTGVALDRTGPWAAACTLCNGWRGPAAPTPGAQREADAGRQDQHQR